MLALLSAYLVSVVYVGLRSTQQLNVVHNRYWLLLPTSLGMAAADYWIINAVVTQNWPIIVAFGLGGATGCAISMKLNNYMRTKNETFQSLFGRKPAQPADSSHRCAPTVSRD